VPGDDTRKCPSRGPGYPQCAIRKGWIILYQGQRKTIQQRLYGIIKKSHENGNDKEIREAAIVAAGIRVYFGASSVLPV
jgi:hypothetical protein